MRETDRRKFLMGVGGTTFSLIAGCGQQPSGDGDGDGDGGDQQTPPPGDGDGGDGGDQQTPPPGDGDGGDGAAQLTYVFSDESDPTNLDPHVVDTTSSVSRFCWPENGYETLIFYPEETAAELVPVLASEVPTKDNGLISADGVTIEFPLREGVQFHTGGEMIADDVVFSFERVKTMNLSPEVGRLDVIDSIEATDDYRVQFNLASEFGPFMTASMTRPVSTIVSQQAIENNGGVQANQPNAFMQENSAGTGPFMAGEWSRGNFFVWERFDDYWDQSTLPDYNRLRQVSSPELATRRAMLERREAHHAWITGAQVADVEGVQGIKIERFPSFDPAHITFNFEIPYDHPDLPDDDTVPPDFFHDPRVRQAFGYAFNYQAYIDSVWGGHANRMKQYHFQGIFGYDETAPNFEYDPDMALQLFEDAGYGDGFTITQFNEDIPQFTNGALLLKDNIESLGPGFEIRVVAEPESRAVERHSGERMLWPFEFHGFLPSGTDPDVYYRDLYSPSGSVGRRTLAHRHVNPRIIEAIDEAAAETSPDARIELYQELQRLCFEDPAAVGVTTEQRVQVALDCVDTGYFNPAWIGFHFKYYSNVNC